MDTTTVMTASERAAELSKRLNALCKRKGEIELALQRERIVQIDATAK